METAHENYWIAFKMFIKITIIVGLIGLIYGFSGERIEIETLSTCPSGQDDCPAYAICDKGNCIEESWTANDILPLRRAFHRAYHRMDRITNRLVDRQKSSRNENKLSSEMQEKLSKAIDELENTKVNAKKIEEALLKLTDRLIFLTGSLELLSNQTLHLREKIERIEMKNLQLNHKLTAVGELFIEGEVDAITAQVTTKKNGSLIQ